MSTPPSPAAPELRWPQRFQSYERALLRLTAALAGSPNTLSELEQEGVVQRFEYTLELAWKTMKDYLDDNAVVIAPPVVPKQVIKAAFAAQVIVDGQVWIDMLTHRNLLSHTYNEVVFQEAVQAITTRYLPALTALQTFMAAQHTP